MKLGLAISAMIVLVIVLTVLVALFRPADAPSRATTGDSLKAQTLPSDVRQLVLPGDRDGDAATLYDQAFRFYQANAAQLRQNDPPEELVRQLRTMLIEAAQATRVSEGFFDRYVKIQAGLYMELEIDDAAGRVAQRVLHHAWFSADQSEQHLKDAIEAVEAVYLMGLRLFDRNVLYASRFNGLYIMENAAAQLENLYREQGDDTRSRRFAGAQREAKEILKAWDDKLKSAMAVPAHIGDLLNVAKNDEELTFRIHATLHMGVALAQPGHRGNRRAMENLLRRYENSDEPLLAEAAKAAIAYRKK